MRERSVGLGVMGFSFLQARSIPFEGAMAKSWNLKIFKHIRAQVDQASMLLARSAAPAPTPPTRARWSGSGCKMAIAPTASISIICGGTSACIEPIPANVYTHKTLSGSFSIRNPHLEALLKEKSKNSEGVWSSILERGGSVQHLDFLTPEEKDVFKTSFEIDQRWLIELAADRTPYIDQAQSLNLFIPADVDKWDLLMLHYRAWELGIKSLYYLRSKSVQRAGFAGGVEADNTPELKEIRSRAPIMTNAWHVSDKLHPAALRLYPERASEAAFPRLLRIGGGVCVGWGPGGTAAAAVPPAAGPEPMTIVDQTKLIIGIVFAVVGLVVLLGSRGTRGFGQRKQAGVMFLIAAVVFVAVGLGWLDL